MDWWQALFGRGARLTIRDLACLAVKVRELLIQEREERHEDGRGRLDGVDRARDGEASGDRHGDNLPGDGSLPLERKAVGRLMAALARPRELGAVWG
jgi:hypothetical protein